MKLSEYKDEAALELLADLIEPAAEIMADKELAKMLKEGKAGLKAVSYAIKNHKEAVMQILALLEGVPVEEYHCNVLTLPAKLLEILNDKELMQLFTLQGQTMEATLSASVLENTEA